MSGLGAPQGGPTVGKVLLVTVAALIVVVGGIAGLFWYTSVDLQHTASPPGDPTKFDPIARFSEIEQFAGPNMKLLSMEADFVKPDGTMDLKASYDPGPHTTYAFVHGVPPPKDAPPVGAGGSASGTWLEPVTVTVSRPGQFRSYSSVSANSSVSYQYFDLGMQREADDVTADVPGTIVAEPICKLSDLWSAAIEQGAPKNSVATITYDNDGYAFDINDANFEMKFDDHCTATEVNNENIGEEGKADVIDEVRAQRIENQSNAPINDPTANYTAIWKKNTWYVLHVTQKTDKGIAAATCYTVTNHSTVNDNGSYVAGTNVTSTIISPETCKPE